RRAFTAAHDFTGSEKSERKLLKPLILVDLFVQARNSGKPSEALETVYAKAALHDNAEEIPYTVDGILEEAEIVYSKMLDAQSHDDILELLQEGGALIKQGNAVFVQTDDGEINSGTSDTPSKFEVKLKPRLAMLVTRLRDEGIYTDDLIIQAGKTDPKMVRENPYHIVQIPRLDKEIAVCDQVGEITFVKTGIIGTDLWANLSKDQLKERSDIQTVIFNNEAQWWSNIKTTLSENSIKPKVNLVKYSGKKPPLDIDLIKQSLLEHHQTTGQWLSNYKKSEEGKKGGYVLEHGPYAGKLTVSALFSALCKGQRGLHGGSSIAKLNEEISSEHDLDYANHMKQEKLDLRQIKESLLAHYQATGGWLSHGKKYTLEHGPYAGKITVSALDSALSSGMRGLLGGASIAKLNEEISGENNLGYVNHKKQENLDIDEIQESLLAHYQATGEWMTNNKKGEDGKRGSYILEHGPLAGHITVSALETNLAQGLRGLPGGASIAKLLEAVSKEFDLGYVNRLNQEDLSLDEVKESLLVHYQTTGEWLSCGKKYTLEHGPYAGKITVSALSHALERGSRGLPGEVSISELNEEISKENNLDYVNHMKQESLDIDKIKESLLAHYQATGEWLSSGKKYTLEYGPYAGKITVGALDADLIKGLRGLPGGSSIAKLKKEIILEEQAKLAPDDDITPQPV
ncbi:MAG: hypothetical protein KZQ86_12650, partial [Candidatus Thiodiazotropha sp. (ex Lucinoma kastoroae)]|nr:hypothetical protein [Candidatus Thiodiazotropha sp. (ex Lucinoma kastoroae)]